LVAHKYAIDGVGDYGTQHCVDERTGLEFHAPIQHLDGKNGRADRGAKDGRKATGHADQDEQSPIRL